MKAMPDLFLYVERQRNFEATLTQGRIVANSGEEFVLDRVMLAPF